MSILNWVRRGTLGNKCPNIPTMPDPTEIENYEEAQLTASCNVEVEKAVTPRKRKRGEYGTYTPETRAKMARYAIENGPAKAARHFSKELGREVNESTIRSIRKLYQSSPSKTKQSVLPHSPRGRPLKLGQYDDLVKAYIRRLRVAGGVVNAQIVMAGAKGILMFKDSTQRKEKGGTIEITKEWARSLLNRMGFSKRKGTKGIKHFPEDFDDIKNAYLKRISDNISKFNIPDELIINWDQTAVNLVPCGEWTMHESGAKQVPIKGVDDKRQITAVLAVTKAGELLPPQLLYQGLTDKCHPEYRFPKSWDVHHSENHWSNADTMKRYVEKIILPYVEQVRDDLDLPLKQKALCIFDVFKAHQDKELLSYMEEKGRKVVFVPAACTDRLQPLDVQINGKFKSLLKSQFQSFYADEVKSALEKGEEVENVSIDLRLSKIKPIHAKWLVYALERLANRDFIVGAFSKVGI